MSAATDTPPVAPPVAGASALSAYRDLLRNPRFRRLWVSQFVSGTGDWLVIGFLIPLVNSLSGGSSFAVAGILIAKIVPAMFLSSVTGVFVDRFDRRKLMIATDLVRAVLALGLMFTNSLAVIYLLVLLMETASLFFFPAKNALIPYLVEDDELAEANGLSYTTQQASMLVGLTMSAAILATFERVVRLVLDANLIGFSKLVGLFAPALLGPRTGVLLDSLTFVISALSIWGIQIAAKPLVNRGARFDLTLVGKDVRESFAFMRSHQELRAFLFTIFVALLGGGVLITVGLVYIQTNLTGGLSILNNIRVLKALTATPQTLFLVFLAVGMVAAAMVVPRLAHKIPLQLLFVGSVALFGVVLVGFSLTTRYLLAVLLAIVAGACIAAVTVAGNTYVVRTTSDEIRGRVFTALESVIRVALLISLVVMSPLNDLVAIVVRNIAVSRELPLHDVSLWAPRITLWLAAAMVIGAAAYGFRNLSWRRGNTISGETGSLGPRGGVG